MGEVLGHLAGTNSLGKRAKRRLGNSDKTNPAARRRLGPRQQDKEKTRQDRQSANVPVRIGWGPSSPQSLFDTGLIGRTCGVKQSRAFQKACEWRQESNIKKPSNQQTPTGGRCHRRHPSSNQCSNFYVAPTGLDWTALNTTRVLTFRPIWIGLERHRCRCCHGRCCRWRL